MHVQVSPHGGFAVEGGVDVVGLVGNHFGDADDEIDEAFAGGPVIADADGGGVDVGVENRGEHAALGGDARVFAGELDFGQMLLARGVYFFQALDEELDDVRVWRISGRRVNA